MGGCTLGNKKFPGELIRRIVIKSLILGLFMKSGVMKYLVFAGIAFFLTVTSCKEEGCPDIFLGAFEMDQVSRDFFPYEEGDKLVFVNDNGVERVFTEAVFDFGVSTQLALVACPDGGQQDVIYNGERGDFTYSSNDIGFTNFYRQTYIDDGAVSDNNIVDEIGFGLRDAAGTIVSRIVIVSHSRGTTQGDDLNQFESLGTIVLGGKSFTGVVKSEVGNPDNTSDLFVSSDQGIIAYTDEQGTLWVFERVE